MLRQPRRVLFAVEVLLLLPLLLALALVQGTTAADGRTALRGAVTTLGPDGVPIYLPGVQVLLRCEKTADKLETTVTDENGRFFFPGLERKQCSVTASAEGFHSETKIVAATEKSAVELSFQLRLLTVTERRDRP